MTTLAYMTVYALPVWLVPTMLACGLLIGGVCLYLTRKAKRKQK